jgi:hypothetical protein
MFARDLLGKGADGVVVNRVSIQASRWDSELEAQSSKYRVRCGESHADQYIAQMSADTWVGPYDRVMFSENLPAGLVRDSGESGQGRSVASLIVRTQRSFLGVGIERPTHFLVRFGNSGRMEASRCAPASRPSQSHIVRSMASGEAKRWLPSC